MGPDARPHWPFRINEEQYYFIRVPLESIAEIVEGIQSST
jgi:hypothetical protein